MLNPASELFRQVLIESTQLIHNFRVNSIEFELCSIVERGVRHCCLLLSWVDAVVRQIIQVRKLFGVSRVPRG